MNCGEIKHYLINIKYLLLPIKVTMKYCFLRLNDEKDVFYFLSVR